MQDALAHQVMIDNKFIHCIKCGTTIGIARKSLIDNKVTLDFTHTKDMRCSGCGTKVKN